MNASSSFNEVVFQFLTGINPVMVKRSRLYALGSNDNSHEGTASAEVHMMFNLKTLTAGATAFTMMASRNG